MNRLALSLLFLFVGACVCEDLSVPGSLDNFEGSYVFPDGSYLYLCQDGVKVEGSFSEKGILRGGVSGASSSLLTGNFWTAGTGPCVTGTFSFILQSYGVNGSYVCNAITGSIPWTATRTSNFRPSDENCALTIDSSSKKNLEGRWINNDGLELNACFIKPTATVDETFQGSLERVNSDGVIVDWFLNGFWVDSGRIFLGTWYQDLSAGAAIFYLRNNGNVDYFWWTGLLHNQGQTYLDINQLNNPALHGKGTYKLPIGGPVEHETTSAACNVDFALKSLVLANLGAAKPDDDDNYYYFIDTEYLDVINYINYTPVASASSLGVSVVLLALIVLLF